MWQKGRSMPAETIAKRFAAHRRKIRGVRSWKESRKIPSSGATAQMDVKGVKFLVDAEDLKFLSQFSWRLAFAGTRYPYARTRNRCHLFGPSDEIRMHRLVLMPALGLETDHINRDTRDNRKCNLRPATNRENQCNRRAQDNNPLALKGVTSKRKMFEASIHVNRRRRYLGLYLTAKDAALAYDEAARRMHGEFACLNFA
jgi:hypothetical protein